MTAVVGVDPSLRALGLAKVVDGELSTHVVVSAPESGLVGMRSRIRYLVGQVLQFAPARCVTVIEAPIAPRRDNAGSVLERAWLFGFIVDQLLERGPVVGVYPSTRAKFATGKGNAGKSEVLAAMRAMFPDVQFKDDNAADAASLALMGARWAGVPAGGPSGVKQDEAMASVVWPESKGEC